MALNVLVTGASGFIGKHTVARLRELGNEPMQFDRHAPTDLLGDVRDAVAVSEAVALCDGVIHVAGVLGTSETISNPSPAVETNIMGSLNVFQACRQYQKRCVYITVGNYWMHNSYSISKTTAENLAWMFNKEHGTEIAVVRALNAYGEGQKAAPVRKIMPNFVLPALRGEPLTIYGDGTQIMDMVYVKDVADILVRALTVNHGQYIYTPERVGNNGVKFEAGTGRPTTVNEIAQIVLDAVGGGTVEHVPMRGGEPEHSVVLGNPETLAPLYPEGRSSLTSLEEGVRRTVAWYRNA
jgi:nucleoside-diphosphate-sugar epimerase